jgi:alpha-methylacyl-CoA racemase
VDRNLTGPLAGLTVIELGGIGPAPFCGMLLADLGARVIVVMRAQRALRPVLDRGKEAIVANLKDRADLRRVKDLIADADAVIEGFRPGVLERLGLGPDVLSQLNQALVLGRITGFGRSGPLSDRAGHDINYIALSGVLGAIGRPGERPVPPLNLVGDFGGGALLLAFGVVAALLRGRTTGVGEIVDAAMIDGSALLMNMIYEFHGTNRWAGERGRNLLDGGAPFYDTYTCADRGYMAVGAVEPQFFRVLVEGLGLDDTVDLHRQNDPGYWPELREHFASAFSRHPRAHWELVFHDQDACVTPVLDLDEVAAHSHNVARKTFSTNGDITAAATAPRFSPLSSHAD